ncbi:hypothetical protein EVAR_69248_1 [Eumeta japonica]|uniref:BESS domain-containing protein n=1 Tax=Eumeta variegata TaxID=151549 RepID=A0A4C1SV54_EUMVA|nr:hypothetical protein EVAR_69248_1 [Eumeta japonica]
MRPPVSQAKKKKKLNAADEEFLAIIKTNVASKLQPDTSNQTNLMMTNCFVCHYIKNFLKYQRKTDFKQKLKVLQAQQALSHKPSTARFAYLPSTQYHFQTGMTQCGQRDYFEETGYNTIDPSTSSFPPATFSSYNRGYCTVERNTQSTTSAYNNPTTPSPASTQDSQESELMELYGD